MNEIGNVGYNDFRTQVMTVEDLLYRLDEVDALGPMGIFRKPTVAQSSRIIESVLLGMPQPMVYVDDTNSNWVVIEGTEHVFAYYAFCKRNMRLSSLYFKKRLYEGLSFYEMSQLAQSNILNTKVTVNVLNRGLSAHERFGIYMCLKSRMDSSSLQWCRAKIFGLEYQWVRDLAKSVSDSKRTEVLENNICYMLVGRYYKSYLNDKSGVHIDAAANQLLEVVYKRGETEVLQSEFRQVLETYLQSRRLFVFSRYIGLYLSVVDNLYREGWSKNKIQESLGKYTFNFSCMEKDDSAAAFSNAINSIINELK